MKRLFCLLVLTACLANCSDSIIAASKSIMTLTPTKVWIEKVQFKVAEDMNNNSPVTVHLLVVYKQETYDTISKMTADDYFKQYEQLRRDNPNMIDFTIWELVPAQAKEEQAISPSRVDGVGAIVFARYSSPGEHRAALADERQVRIVLEKLDFYTEKIG